MRKVVRCYSSSHILCALLLKDSKFLKFPRNFLKEEANTMWRCAIWHIFQLEICLTTVVVASSATWENAAARNRLTNLNYQVTSLISSAGGSIWHQFHFSLRERDESNLRKSNWKFIRISRHRSRWLMKLFEKRSAKRDTTDGQMKFQHRHANLTSHLRSLDFFIPAFWLLHSLARLTLEDLSRCVGLKKNRRRESEVEWRESRKIRKKTL